MGSQTKKVTARLEAVNVSWGRRQCRTVATVDNAADFLDGKYLPLNYIDSSGSEVLGYIWFDSDAGAVDPAPAGLTLIGAVTITAASTAAQIAAAIKTVIDADANFKDATVSGSTVTIENAKVGAITAETDADSTTFTLAVLVTGIGGDLGATEGGISLNMETSTVEINADQFGELLLDEVITGNAASVEMSLLEMTPERWKTIVGSVVGDNLTGGSSEVTGIGESKLYQNLNDLSGELVLNPVRLGASDRSANITFWNSAPLPSSINFSGTETQKMEVTFKAYLDSNKDTKINLMMYGDNEQTGLDA